MLVLKQVLIIGSVEKMDKQEYKNLDIAERATYINSEMKKGKSFSAICRELGVSKGSQGTTFKSYGYKLINGQYIKSDEEINKEEHKADAKESNIVEHINKENDTENVKRNVGRPQKHEKDGKGNKINKSKMTIEIDNNVITALRLKKTLEGITINDYIEDILYKNIEKKYFEMQK